MWNTIFSNPSNIVDKTAKGVESSYFFASTDVDCGAYTQDRMGAMIHINTEKCHNETYRPTITLVFASETAISEGSFVVGANASPETGKVYLTASDYMNPNLQPQIAWLAVEGSVDITVNEDDASKFDVEFKTIKMKNTSFALTTDIPEFDTLTGFIIGI